MKCRKFYRFPQVGTTDSIVRQRTYDFASEKKNVLVKVRRNMHLK